MSDVFSCEDSISHGTKSGGKRTLTYALKRRARENRRMKRRRIRSFAKNSEEFPVIGEMAILKRDDENAGEKRETKEGSDWELKTSHPNKVGIERKKKDLF